VRGEGPITAPTLALVPLDDRPCNRLFPAQLAPIAGWQVALPPRTSLGWFTKPGDCDAIAEWLREFEGDRFVVSLDMLCFGGLVASRRPAAELDEAARRLHTLRAVRRDRPGCVLYAFSLITRLGTNVTSAADLEAHDLLRAYSQLVDRVERLGEEAAREELDAVAARLDPSVLASYLAVRRRNHAINRAAVQLVADGVVDYLILAQEDAAPLGMHIPEQLALRDQAAEFRVADRVSIHPGADEAGLILIARHCVKATGRPIRLAAEYAADEGAEVVPLFQNHSLRQTVETQMLAGGARPTATDDAEAILLVHTPSGHQTDIADAPPLGQAPLLAAQGNRLSERIRAAKAAGRAVGLADAAYCNGADPELIAALRRTGAARDLDAFAAWNTAANTVGTVVAHLCLQAAGDRAPSRIEPAASRTFLASRLVDDYGYQSVARQRAIAHARQTGADPHALGPAWQDLEAYVNAELVPLSHSIYSDLLAAPDDGFGVEVGASLPWHRLFEVELELAWPPGPKNRR